METGDVLWGNFYVENASFDKKPNQVFPELDNVNNLFTRELPYSFDYLVENFMDPAHIPFAHHGLQGVRVSCLKMSKNCISRVKSGDSYAVGGITHYEFMLSFDVKLYSIVSGVPLVSRVVSNTCFA